MKIGRFCVRSLPLGRTTPEKFYFKPFSPTLETIKENDKEQSDQNVYDDKSGSLRPASLNPFCLSRQAGQWPQGG